ncbi:uncharacterized protein LOC132544202 [Ylistrum balloti]|uniref:uncharacterized protein LOC132544202 n=1 Tax=Ylistrum balloti TaxID=509963 RepID=UPI002905EB27|nr:uncharacterized protein LOC132544202 [Ylistrum balloti]
MAYHFFLHDFDTFAADMHLYTDATDKDFGGIYGHKWFQGSFPEDMTIAGERISMAFLELYPIVMACVLWGQEWTKKRIVFHCDNMSTVDIINKGRSKVSLIMKLMRKLTLVSAYYNFTVRAKHIPGIDNTIADAISRFQMTKFRRLAPWADPQPTPCLSASNLLTLGETKLISYGTMQ